MKSIFIPDSSVPVLVVGDIILDRYVYGETTRISPEAPVPVVLVQQTEDRAGGAGNVACNLSSLGMKATLVGMAGNDAAADTLMRILADGHVKCSLVRPDGFTTITKLRILSQHQQLLRLDYEPHAGSAYTNSLLETFRKELPGAGLVILSDYAKGGLQNVQAYIKECRQHDIKVLVDPKGTDFGRYRGASLLTPNLKEFEAVVGPCGNDDMLVEKGLTLRAALGLDALLVTKGDRGMTLISHGNPVVHLGTEAREVFDVTGAGDTVIATMAACLASGYSHKEAMVFANRAAGLVVGKLGTASVTVEELNNATARGGHAAAGIMAEEELLRIIDAIRDKGGTIVMTNGCFDILHAGHVHYLKLAKELGDYLIVAVNDDQSVTRLKGAGRPVNPLPQRLEVLNALKAVDCAVPFSEDTPERLIRLVVPDILVKGGDYSTEDIAGADFVRKHGGTVRLIPLYGEFSTTRILDGSKSGQNKK